MPTTAVSAPTTTPTGPRRYHARTVLVCFPSTAQPDWYTVSERINDLTDRPNAGPAWVFRVPRWHIRRSQLINPTRQGRWWLAAGGRIGTLRLDRIREWAGRRADVDWHTWRAVTAATPPARTWAQIARRHPEASRPQITRMFREQPRIAAMLAHNASPAATVRFDLDNLEAFQAGYYAYWQLQVLTAAVGDELLTMKGDRLFPQSASLADQFAYLNKANHHLDCLMPGHWLVCARLQ